MRGRSPGGSPSGRRRFDLALNVAAVCAILIAGVTIVGRNLPDHNRHRLVNVSYDATRELYQAIDPLFVASYQKVTAEHWEIVLSHGGSSRQAMRIALGEQPADVVTLGLPSDIELLRQRGLIAAGWTDRLPNRSRPYTSTIVFVVRAGNPHAIHDWPDLLAPGVAIVVPDPRSSGNGKLAALAAWASVTTRGGSEAAARTFLSALYQHVDMLDPGAQTAAIRFASEEIGDVHLVWENSALREVAASKGRLEVVYPPVSILAEPAIALVDSVATRDGSARAARAYLAFLYSPQAQAIIAGLGFRPAVAVAADRAGIHFADIRLVPVSALAPDWRQANEMFFGEGGIVTALIPARLR